MITPLINELTTIPKKQNTATLNASAQLMTSQVHCDAKISSNYAINKNPKIFIQNIEINNQNSDKITYKCNNHIQYKVKTNIIKYHNFSRNNNKANPLDFKSTNTNLRQKNCQYQVHNFNQSILKNKKQYRKFSKNEDKILLNIVNQYGAKDWKYISSYLPGRTSRQCRDRYRNYLDPSIINSTWNEEEDQLLTEKYSIYGPKWTIIAQFFPNRTANNIKNRYNYTISRRINDIKTLINQ